MRTSLKILSIVLVTCILLIGCKERTVADEPKTEQKASEMAAPDFTLTDHLGNTLSLEDYEGKIIVLEWTNPDCPFVKRHYKAETMTTLANKYMPKGVVWLTINSTNYADTEMNKKFVEQWGLKYPVLDDSDGKVGKLYGAKTTPHMFIIDTSGQIAYHGAIDDDPAGNKEEIVNYVGKALDELLAGKEVSTPEVKPYGCSVKYAD